MNAAGTSDLRKAKGRVDLNCTRYAGNLYHNIFP
jgi:hypothetical protein